MSIIKFIRLALFASERAGRGQWSVDQRTTKKISNVSNRGIKHDFPFINIRKVPREASTFPRDLANVNEYKIMFDRYYCIISTKTLQKRRNYWRTLFYSLSHFPTRKICMIRAEFKLSSLPTCFV